MPSTLPSTRARPAPTPPPGRGGMVAQDGQKLFLMPGQWYFGGKASELRTLLGSCVAVTLWHPKKRWGGMCHFLLPERRRTPSTVLDARYGDEAVDLLFATAHAELDLGDEAGRAFGVGDQRLQLRPGELADLAGR